MKGLKPKTPNSKDIFKLGAGEMAQLMVKSTCCSCSEDPGSVPKIYMIVHNCP